MPAYSIVTPDPYSLQLSLGREEPFSLAGIMKRNSEIYRGLTHPLVPAFPPASPPATVAVAAHERAGTFWGNGGGGVWETVQARSRSTHLSDVSAFDAHA